METAEADITVAVTIAAVMEAIEVAIAEVIIRTIRMTAVAVKYNKCKIMQALRLALLNISNFVS